MRIFGGLAELVRHRVANPAGTTALCRFESCTLRQMYSGPVKGFDGKESLQGPLSDPRSIRGRSTNGEIYRRGSGTGCKPVGLCASGGSTPSLPTNVPVVQLVRTPAFHAGNKGSSPFGNAKFLKDVKNV